MCICGASHTSLALPALLLSHFLMIGFVLYVIHTNDEMRIRVFPRVHGGENRTLWSHPLLSWLSACSCSSCAIHLHDIKLSAYSFPLADLVSSLCPSCAQSNTPSVPQMPKVAKQAGGRNTYIARGILAFSKSTNQDKTGRWRFANKGGPKKAAKPAAPAVRISAVCKLCGNTRLSFIHARVSVSAPSSGSLRHGSCLVSSSASCASLGPNVRQL